MTCRVVADDNHRGDLWEQVQVLLQGTATTEAEQQSGLGRLGDSEDFVRSNATQTRAITLNCCRRNGEEVWHQLSCWQTQGCLSRFVCAGPHITSVLFKIATVVQIDGMDCYAEALQLALQPPFSTANTYNFQTAIPEVSVRVYL